MKKSFVTSIATMLLALSFATPGFAETCHFDAKADSVINNFLKTDPQIDLVRYEHPELTDAEYLKALEEEDTTIDEIAFEFEPYSFLLKKGSTIDCSSKLTQDENMMVFMYTVQYFGLFNTILRKGTEAHKNQIKPMVDLLSTALSKLDPYTGPVARGLKELSPEVLAAYVPGATVTFDAFTSTTKDLNSNYTKNPTLMLITSKTGKDISTLSYHSYEQEVLFDKGASFKVISVEKKPLSADNEYLQTVIVLEEI